MVWWSDLNKNTILREYKSVICLILVGIHTKYSKLYSIKKLPRHPPPSKSTDGW